VTFLIALTVGAVVGGLLGMLGGGGAILAVPALVYLLGQHPKAATFGSLLIVLVSAPVALIGHWRAGRVRLGAGVAFAAAGLAGSFLGSRVSISANPNVLLVGFAGLMLIIAGLMAWRLRRTKVPAAAAALMQSQQAEVPTATMTGRSLDSAGVLAAAGPTVRPGSAVTADGDRGRAWHGGRLPILVTTATGIGFLTGLFGVGGGIIVVPTLVLVLGFEMPIAVGTSLVVIILNSLEAMAARVGGHISLDWAILAVFTASAIAGAVAGNRLAGRVNTRRLTQAFIGLIIVVACYTAARSLLQLTV